MRPAVAAILFRLVLTLAATGAAGTGAAEIPDLRTRTDGEDWPTFLGPDGDNTSRETGLRRDWSAGLPIRWQRPAGEGYGNVSVARGRAFFFDREGDRARLTCLNSETGEVLWQTGYPTAYEDLYGYSGGPRTTPVVDGERVYTYGVEGLLRCQRAVDGALLWQVDTAAAYGVVQNFFGVGSTPAIEGELLIVPVGGSPPDSPGVQSGELRANGTAIVAFDKRTGVERYRLGDALASYASPRLVTLGGRRWGFHLARGGLIGFDPLRGTVDFVFPWRARLLESVNAATPVVIGDRVFITETYGPGGALLKIAPDGPDVVWRDSRRARSLACHWNTPIHHRGYLYGSSGRGRGDAELRCVELATGTVTWSKPGFGRSTLLYADGHLLVLSENGTLRLAAATPERYHQLAELVLRDAGGQPLLRAPAWHAPVLSHGLLYLRAKDRLVALELIPPPAAR